MSSDVPHPPPPFIPTRGISSGKQLSGELARANLEAVKASAAALGPDALRELRDWIDSRLAVGKPRESQAGASLSEQETRALQLIALGYSNKEVAAQMKVSVKTVETYKARAVEKLRLRTRVQLIRLADV